jgi:hypothetical protein
MKISTKSIWSTVFVLLVMVCGERLQTASAQEDPQSESEILVGRIAHAEGVIERYDPDQDNWMEAVKDSPIAAGETLYADKNGRAELILPNYTLVRINGDTRIELIRLQDDQTQIDMAFGLARFYSTGSDSILRATTRLGNVIAPANTSFDLYLDDELLQVTVRQGTVEFVDGSTGETYSVTAGDPSLTADDREVSFADYDLDPDWQAWNDDRDRLLQEREQLAEASMQYLPDELAADAWPLQEYGRWEPVYYQNAYHYFWRPVYVSRGWAPFTVGRWVWWYGDWTWIPYEPFGYVTCHYGSWVYTSGCWYWAPPLRRAAVYSGPRRFFIGFGWCPGRVAWLDHDGYIGWVPLGPQETFFAHRRWGPHTLVVENTNIINVGISANRFHNVGHAVVIRRADFFSAKNFADLKVADIDRTLLVNSFKVGQGPRPVVAAARREIPKQRNMTRIEEPRRNQTKLITDRQTSRQFATGPVKSAASADRRPAATAGFKKPVEMNRAIPAQPTVVAKRPVHRNNRAVSETKSAPEQTASRVVAERQIPLSKTFKSPQMKGQSPNHPQRTASVLGKGQIKPSVAAKSTAPRRRSRILETITRPMARGPQQNFK